MPETEAHPMLANLLLSALPEADRQRLTPHLEQTSLVPGQVLFEAGHPISEVYFPAGAAIALLSPMENGTTSAIATVGREGFVGLPVFLGGQSTVHRAVVQTAGLAFKVDATVFKNEYARSEKFSRLLLLYTQALLTQIAQTASCRSHHEIDKRLARWLLLLSDCTGQPELQLTQKRISEMMGVRRASITEAAIALQDSGIIRYTRGRILILDRSALEAKVCECYRLTKSEFERLLLKSTTPNDNEYTAIIT
ncbi:Crp/Fnr family transcriptional regulator [Oscillatoria sp. FACHB-1406]|uniref:Crp/Fnr family transcriptional regulator n=1 Tax=Oscillatoria sp. FACHB-1406 TaxID=2692846 RepID=UPI0016874001|nr:Crp/Fnr family transcriptional regulator [Oscillatoria sp. FACHB-1406]MBD2578759.1 Crp/Fnr family transcriptional regulator [Oscillatoria sp. FACHB-1406]